MPFDEGHEVEGTKRPRQHESERQVAPSKGAREPGRGRHATSPLSIPWKGWKDILLRTYGQINEDRVFAIAGGVVFFALLAIFPATTAMISLYGLFADVSTAQDNLASIASAVPASAYSIIEEQITRLVENGNSELSLGFAFGLAIALWSANAGMKAVIDALNIVYGEREKRGFIHLNLVSLAFTLGGLIFVLLAVATVVIVPLVLDSLGLGDFGKIALSILRWPAIFLLLLAGLAILYRYAPSRREAKWQWISVGSASAAVLWVVASAAFSFYLASFAHYDATYGTLGGAIGLMMWMWISLIVIFAGAELNAEIEHQTTTDTTVGKEKPMGERGAQMADTLGSKQGA